MGSFFNNKALLGGGGYLVPCLIFKTLCFTDAFRRKLCVCRYFTIAFVVASQFQFILMTRLSSFRIACSRRSNSRTRRSDGGDPERVKLYTGKTGGKNEGRFVFFLREFFSCAVLSERLKQATFQLSNWMLLFQCHVVCGNSLYQGLFNPLSPKIHKQILQTDLHTFLLRIVEGIWFKIKAFSLW